MLDRASEVTTAGNRPSAYGKVTIGEGSGRIPRGTHDWDKFLSPDELCGHLAAAGLETEDVTGLGWSPTRGFCLTDDKSLNYLVTAKRARP